MPVRTIKCRSSQLPPLALPPGGLSPSDSEYQHSVSEHRPEVEPIEHRIRLAIRRAPRPKLSDLLGSYSHYNNGPESNDPWLPPAYSKPRAVHNIEAEIEAQWEEDREVFEKSNSKALVSQAPSYLQSVIRSNRENPSKLQSERKNRRKWYELMPWKSVYPVFKRDSLGELLEPLNGGPTVNPPSDNSYIGIIVVSDDTDTRQAASRYGVDDSWVSNESEFATHSGGTELPVPSDFGIELPAPLLLGSYANESEYLLIPWTGGLCCQCPFKSDSPYRVLCKHEAFASVYLGLGQRDDIVLPVDKGLTVPVRARRFIGPRHAAEV